MNFLGAVPEGLLDITLLKVEGIKGVSTDKRLAIKESVNFSLSLQVRLYHEGCLQMQA